MEGAHAAALFAAVKRELAKDIFHTFAKAADLDELGLDGEPEAAAEKQNDQDIVRQIRVDRLHNREQNVVHYGSSCFFGTGGKYPISPFYVPVVIILHNNFTFINGLAYARLCLYGVFCIGFHIEYANISFWRPKNDY